MAGSSWRNRQPLNPINRRGTDPYARWCGRGGAARLPAIPINQGRRHPVRGRSGLILTGELVPSAQASNAGMPASILVTPRREDRRDWSFLAWSRFARRPTRTRRSIEAKRADGRGCFLPRPQLDFQVAGRPGSGREPQERHDTSVRAHTVIGQNGMTYVGRYSCHCLSAEVIRASPSCPP